MEPLKETVDNQIITKETNIKDVLKGAEGTLTVLEDYNDTKEKLTAIAKDLAPQVEQLVELKDFNAEQMAKAKEIRAILREPRYAVQNVVKHNTKTLNDAKSTDKKRLEDLITDVVPLEDRIDGKIKEIEKKRSDEKAAKEEDERRRVSEINRKIADAGVKFERLLSIGKTEEDLQEFDALVNDFESKLEEDLQEFAFEGSELLEGVKARRVEISDRLAETIRVAEQAKENAGKEAELAEKEAELNRQKAEQDRELQRYADVRAIDLIFDGDGMFLKGDFNISVVEIKTDSDEDFKAKLDRIKNEMERRANEAVKKASLQSKFNALSDEYKELTGENYPELSVELSEEVLATVSEVVLAKSKEIENAAKEQISIDGRIFYTRALQHFEEFRQECKIETLPEGEVKNELKKYVEQNWENLERLRKSLYLEVINKDVV